jgi:hypothetical protein
VTDLRKIVIAVDAKGYSGTAASEHSVIQRDLRDILRGAAVDARLPYDQWIEQQQGDGVLAVAPLDIEPRYIDDFIDHLRAHLRRRNRDRVPEARLRVRVALDQGPAGVAANGFTGEAPVLACRLRDAEVTKQALADSDSDVVLAVSDQMFRDNVADDRTRMTPAEFTRVEIQEDRVNAVAWLWLPPGAASQTLQEARAHKHAPTARAAPTINFDQDAQKIINAVGDGIRIDVD